jgi:cytoskeletal protein CcmA (bactofilin family)
MVKNLPSVERSTKIRFGKHVPDSNDQEENTIVFNASNVAVPTPYSNAVYLSPIRNRTNYEAPEIVLLMYDRNTKEITESGESANALIGGSTLDTVTNRNNATSNVVQFIGSLTGASFVTDSNVGLSNIDPQHTVSVGSNLYIDEFGSNVLVVSGNVAVLKDMIVEGNLTVNGDTTVIYTENTSIKDAFIELGADNTSGDTTLDLGLLMHRPDALSNVVIGYREGNDEFAIAYTDAQPTDKTFVPKTDEDINVHVYGLTHVDANIYAHEDVLVDGNVYVSQNVSVTEELTVTGNVYADKDLEIVGNAYVDGNVVAYKDLTLSGNAYVTGNVNVTKQLSVSGNAYISGNVEVTESLIVSANTHLKGDNVFITHTMDFLDPTTAIVTDQVSNVQIRLGQLENVANTASNPLINQVLTYDQDNSEWSNAYPDQTIVQVKNTSGAPMTRGQAVHVTGSNGNNTFEVELADASDPTKMPSIGIVYEDIPINGQGAVVTFGRANGISGISGYTNGDTLYVASGTPGGLTNVKPYGVDLDLIQNVGVVVNHNSGVMFVTGIGRSNDIPNARIITDYNDMQYVYVNSENNDLKKITSANLNIPLTTAVSSSSNSVANAVTLRGVSITSGDGFHGDLVVAGNVAVDTNTFKVDAEANRVGILTASPGQTLDVRGDANVGTFTTTTGTVTDATHSTSKDTGVLVLTQGGLGVEANIHSTNVFAASHIAVGTSATSNTFDVRGTANVGALVTTSTHISDSTTATSKTTGALQVTGGVGIQGDIHATHANLEDVEADSVTVTDATAATDKTSGALQVAGGVGVQGDLYATNGVFTTNVYIADHSDLNNKYLAMIDTNGSLIQSPVYVAPSGKYVISAAEAEFLGNITLGGNTTLLTSTSLIVEDRIIGIGSNNSAEGLDSGIIIEHQDEGVFANIALIHHADEHRFSIGYTQNTLTDNHILNASHPDNVTLRIDLIGNTIVQNNLSVSKMGTFGTKVGIATTTPVANIHVVGNVFVTSNITTSSNVLVNGDAAATSKTTGALQVTGGVGVQGDIYSTNVTGSGTLKGATLTGTNLYGTLSGSNTASVTTLTASDTTVADSTTTGALTVAGGISTQDNVYVGRNVFITSNLNVDGSTLHVDSMTSNVGIGKTNPGFTLDVDGDINFSGTFYEGGVEFVSSPWTIETVPDALSYTAGNVGIGAANPDSTLQITGNTYVSSNLQVGEVANLYVDTENTRVGIGKTDPGFTLDVAGDINFSGSLYEGGSLFVSTPWTIDGNDLEYTSGNIGIGTDAANATLHVGGNIYSSSNISAYEIEVANVTTTNLIMNTVTVSATLSLDNAITVSNITSNTVQFTNSNVGVVATGNVHANYFKGDGSELTGITIQNVSDLGNTTSNTVQFTNSNVSLVTTSNIHVGGIAKQSSVPAFTVRLTDGTIAGAGDIDYNQVDTDNTSSYTTVDGRFTAPVAGHYFFSAHGIYQNDVTVYDFTINGTRQNINSLCSAPTSNYIQCNISAVLNLNIGDYVTVYQVEGGTFGTDNNVFTGFFIG